MGKKKLLITVFHSFISKNILNTDLFNQLVDNQNLEIVLLIPLAKLDFYEANYNSKNVKIYGIDANLITNNLTVRFFSRLAFLIQSSHYLHYKKIERRLGAKNKAIGFIKYYLEVIVSRLLADRQLIRKIFRQTFFIFSSHLEVNKLFDNLNPDVLLATDIFDERDVLIVREAKKRKIKTIGMVRSWDNCYSKGVLRVLPDWLIVNNEVIKDEVETIHDIPTDNIFVGGLPQFDNFLKKPITPRDEFCRLTGLNPKKRFVIFAPAGNILSATDWQIAEILKIAKQEKQLPDIQFLIRNHPNHPADFSNFFDDNDFVVELPGKLFSSQNLKETELTKDDSQHLADSLYHSSVVIYVATSLGLDALVFNKPQIIVDFDGFEEKNYWQSVRRYHDEDHMKKMIACGGVKVATDAKQLIKMINDYLENPSLDQIGRDKMLNQQLYKNDGQSSHRIANFILTKIEPKAF